jgi:hypothetical protein
MNFTNKHGLPPALVKALSTDLDDAGDADDDAPVTDEDDDLF